MTSNNTPPRAAGPGIWGLLGLWIAFGALFGLLVGVFFDNVGPGIALGSGLGLVVYLVFVAPRRNARGGS